MEAVIESTSQVVSFKLAEETFGVDILKVRDIIRYMPITRMPGSPAGVEGVINLRGQIIPVVDLRSRLGLDVQAATNITRIIVVELERGVTGFIVDDVRMVISLESAAVEPAPEMARGIDVDYVRGVARLEDELVILIDFDRVMESRESSKFAA